MGQLLMHGMDCGRLNTQVDHTCLKPLHEDQRPKVPVSGDKEPDLGVRRGQQRLIERPRRTDVCSREHIMPGITEKAYGHGVDVLVEQESHGAVIWISSATMTSIA